MKFSRLLIIGAVLSMILHGLGSAYFFSAPDAVSIAGSNGGALSMVGSLADLLAGADIAVERPAKVIDRVVEPVQSPVEAVPVPAETSHVTLLSPIPPPTLSEVVVAEKKTVNVVDTKREEDTETVLPDVAEMQTQTDRIVAQVSDQAITPEPPEPDPTPPVASTTANTEAVSSDTTSEQAADQGNAVQDAVKGAEITATEFGSSNAHGETHANGKDGGTEALSNYQGKVLTKLRRAKQYPKRVRGKRLSSVVMIAFTVSASGAVSALRVTQSSNNKWLDQAALDMVKRASPMPQFPNDINQTMIKFQVPVRFDQ